MIKFSCESCGQKLSVDEKHSGKRVKCPKCGGVSVVPDNAEKIKFHCESCGQSISVPQIHAGKRGKCPKCKTPVVIPSPEIPPVQPEEADPPIPPGFEEESYTDEYPYDEEPYQPEESDGIDHRIIFAICGGVAVLIVGIIILVTVILPSGSKPAEGPYQRPGQESVEMDSSLNTFASDAENSGAFTPQPPNNEITPNEQTQTSILANDNTGKIDLKHLLKQDQKYDMRIVREDNLSQTVDGQQQNSGYLNTTELRFEVENIDLNGVAWLKVTFLTIKEKMTVGQKEYDSTKPDTTAKYPSGRQYSATIGQSFTAKVSPKAKMLEFEGLDEMFFRIAKTIVESRGKANKKKIEANIKMIERHYRAGREQIKEMVRDVIMNFPDGPVGIGDSWQSPTSITFMRAIDLDDSTYTLRENNQSHTRVDMRLKIDMNNKPTLAVHGYQDSSTATLTGSSEGYIELEPSTGWVLHKKVSLRCSGKMNNPPTERNPQGKTIPIMVEHVITVEPVN